MKTGCSIPVCSLFVLGFIAGVVGPRAAAQTLPGLSIRIVGQQPQLTVTGAVGTACQIQWANALSSSTRWYHLQHCVLTNSPTVLTDSPTPPAASRFYRAVWTPNTNFVWISPGTFTMGSPPNELDRDASEGPQTVVTLTKGFWMGKYEVTQGEYLAIMGINPSWFNGDRTTSGEKDYGIDLTRPVESMTWYEARNFCTALTQQEQATGQIPFNCTYRLPTEAEWEYASRAGTTTRFSYGDDPGYTALASYGWYGEHSFGQTHPAGQKFANPWGLYDMYGNVWESCQDWWSGSLPGGAVVDPQGPASGSINIIRGGGFRSYSGFCRSAGRFYGYGLDSRATEIGIRLVLAFGP